MPNDLNQRPGRSDETSRSNSGSQQESSRQDQREDVNVNNPQQGKEWSNYQTRELGGEKTSSESAEEASKAFGDE